LFSGDLIKVTKSYVVKVSSVGQLTLPKEVREELGIKRDDYVVIEKIGQTNFIKKLDGEKEILERIRERVKKSGITREHLEEIVEEESRDAWEKRESLS
jgi:AbrB family looped-hinge helix DNA binding protein